MNKIKCIIAALCLMTGVCHAADAYEYVSENGQTYIQINEDLDLFRFESDFKSIGNSGAVGYVINGQTRTPIEEFSKADGAVSIKSLKSGDKLGFYLNRKNGDMVTGWQIVEHNGNTYIKFDKNGGTGKDKWMSIGTIHVVLAQHGDDPSSGMPLPGIIPALLIGSGCLGFGIWCRKKKTI